MDKKLNATYNIANENLALWSEDANPHVASNKIRDKLVHSSRRDIWTDSKMYAHCEQFIVSSTNVLKK